MLMPEGLRNISFLICGLGCFLCGGFALLTGKKLFAATGVLFILGLIMACTLF